MTEALGSVQSEQASPATSANQRLTTTAGDTAVPRASLTGPQIATELGAPIPIVFGKRDSETETGGIWLDAPLVEARFTNDLQNNLDYSYLLVLSEGEIEPIPSTDVYQGAVQRGTSQFAYDTRADVWQPGNFVVQRWDTIEYNSLSQISSGPQQVYETTLRSRGNYVTSFVVTHTNISQGTGVTSLPNFTATGNPTVEQRPIIANFVETGNLTAKISGNLTQIFEQDIQEVDRPPLPLPSCVSFTGTGGTYAGLSNLSFQHQVASGDETYLEQVHVFVRGGIKVTKLTDGTVGSSDLFPDLANYLLAANLPTDLIDLELLEESARFCDAQGLKFNGLLSAPQNLRDFINRVAGMTMLTVTQRQGKIGLRPAVPYNDQYEIYAGPTVSRLLIDESNCIENSFQVVYRPTTDRIPYVAEALWRDQPEGNIGVQRASTVKFADTPELAPVRQFDMSDFATAHEHAVKVAASIISRDRHVTHTATCTLQPGSYAGQLIPGDVVEVALRSDSSNDELEAASDHHYYYQVNSVSTNREGFVGLELTHWPVDENGVSLIALDVANVDPASVGTSGTGLPQEVTSDFDFYEEQFFANSYTTISFTQENNGQQITFCAIASQPISNGPLYLKLNTGDTIVIPEGETTGCVTRDVGDGILVFIGDLDATLAALGLLDLNIGALDQLEASLDVFDPNLTLDQLSQPNLEALLVQILELDGILDLGIDIGDLSGLTALDLQGLTLEELQALDLGDLGNLTIGDINLLIGNLSIDEIKLDLEIGDLLTGEDGLQVELADGINLDLSDLQLNDLEIEGGSGGDFDANINGDFGGDFIISSLSIDLDEDEIEEDAEECATEANPDYGAIEGLELTQGVGYNGGVRDVVMYGGSGSGARVRIDFGEGGIGETSPVGIVSISDPGKGYEVGDILYIVNDGSTGLQIGQGANLTVTDIDDTGLDPTQGPLTPKATAKFNLENDSGYEDGRLTIRIDITPGSQPHPQRGDLVLKVEPTDTTYYDKEGEIDEEATGEGTNHMVTIPEDIFTVPAYVKDEYDPNAVADRQVLIQTFTAPVIDVSQIPEVGGKAVVTFEITETTGGYCTVDTPNQLVVEIERLGGVICVSVIDESSNSDGGCTNAEMNELRQKYPGVHVGVLVPGDTSDVSNCGFDFFTQVNRSGEEDGGGTSNWFGTVTNGIDLEDYKFCSLFIDNSGSMTRDTVRPDIGPFKSKMSQAGITVKETSSSSEQTIAPHLEQTFP